MNILGQEQNRGEGPRPREAARWGLAGVVGAEKILGTGRPGRRAGTRPWSGHAVAAARGATRPRMATA